MTQTIRKKNIQTELDDYERPKGLFILDKKAFDEIYGPEQVDIIRSQVDIYAPLQTRESVKENPNIIKDADIIFSGWGVPLFDDKLLSYADNLDIIFYGSGSVKHFVTKSLWEKGVRVSSAAIANAVPVAEYTLGQILLSLKRSWYYANKIRAEKTFAPSVCNVPGGYNAAVGIISLGTIARLLCEHLERFDLDLIAYDPYILPEDLKGLDINLAELDDVFSRSDIVSLHTPLTDETEGMITGDHFSRMKYGSTFINTARGALVREDEMIDVLKERTDITVILDVTNPEPPLEDSELYTLPNVMITPHLAGAMGNERRRLGSFVVDEMLRYLNDRPLKGEVKEELLTIQA